MTIKQVNYINKETEILVNYINHLADLDKKYRQGIVNLCEKNKVDIKKVKKSDESIKFEKDLKNSYDKAMRLYKDLEYIKNLYRCSGDVRWELRDYHNTRTMTRLPIYKSLTLKLETTTIPSAKGVPTGGASPVQNVQDMYTRNINHEKEQIEKFTNTIKQVPNAITDFIKNYNDMKEANTIGADKYFHAKANTEAAQRGLLGDLTAFFISNLREITDTFKNTLIKGMTLKDSLEDSIEDLEANKFGRIQGRNNPNKDSRELVDKYRPNGLPEKY